MTLEGRLTYSYDPMTVAVRAMNTQAKVLNIHAQNVAKADIPGYQRRLAVGTTFIETLGHKGVNEVVDTQVGRIFYTGKPLDMSLEQRGYFQLLQADGRIHVTRDGRFKLDNEGNLLSLDNKRVLSKSGLPIQFPFIPNDPDDIAIDRNGIITVRANPVANQKETVVAQIGALSEDGSRLDQMEFRQGYAEHSNVSLHEEFVGFVAPRRNFSANRQVFLLQSQTLSRMIQELGRAQ